MHVIALTVYENNGKPLMVLPFASYKSLRAYWRKTGYKWKAYKVQRIPASEFGKLREEAKLQPPDCGPVHRLLLAGERLVEGDEWYSSSAERWIETSTAGSVPDPSIYYRRSDVGEGYRLLKVGERIELGDEYLVQLDGESKWIDTACVGMKIPPHSAGKKGFTSYYRRKVVQPRRLPEPPEGYYRMSSIEVIHRDDIFHNGDGWEKARLTGTPVGSLVGMYARPLKGFAKAETEQTPDSTAGKDAETKHELTTI